MVQSCAVDEYTTRDDSQQAYIHENEQRSVYGRVLTVSLDLDELSHTLVS